MFGASPVSLWRIDLALRIGESFDQVDILEVDLIHFDITEMTDFLFCLRAIVIVVIVYFHSYNTNLRMYANFANMRIDSRICRFA